GGAGGFGGGGGRGGAGGASGISTGTRAASGTGGTDGPGGFAGSGTSTDAGAGSGFGGAIFNQGGTVVISDSTITANTATGGNATGTAQHGGGYGGGVFNLNGQITLQSTTIADNSVVDGTGGAGGPAFPTDGAEFYTASVNVGTATPTQTALVTVADTIISHTAAGGDAVVNDMDPASPGTSTINATGPNIRFGSISSTGTDSGTAFTAADPKLGPLADNGGPTKTLAPLDGSPAIDAGANAAGLMTDQRGLPRPSGKAADIGSVELQVSVLGGTLTPAPLVASGTADGSAVLFAPGTGGQYPSTPTATLSPFGAIGSNVRTATGDVDGDGTPDTILVTGPGVPIRFAVISGKDNKTVLIPPTAPFAGSEDFTGGGFAAAVDLDGDGKAEIIITPDQGGGPRVTIFSLVGSTPTVRANFFGIDDPNFRGGARAALGDVNGDGTPDLAVAAGFLGGPRVALFDGKSLFTTPTRLVGDFFAFPGSDAVTLRNGVFLSIGDVDGDGKADLIFGGGPGGAPRVFILSGALVAANNVAGAEAAPIANFFVAGNADDRGGVRVAAKDADGDAKADVVVGSGTDDPARVRVYPGRGFTGSGEPTTFQDLAPFGGAVLSDGVYVG
ncbi:MAG TPA: VCBS repeat-containing protein, partial [Urbifossiella sp.]|nr:VCBS repeat-containing protein [Urbifossiella sp.]